MHWILTHSLKKKNPVGAAWLLSRMIPNFNINIAAILHHIFSPCWHNVIDFVWLDEIVFVYRINRFDDIVPNYI